MLLKDLLESPALIYFTIEQSVLWRYTYINNILYQFFLCHFLITSQSPFLDRRGTPRQPQLVPAAKGRIRFDRRVIQQEHFEELNQFSHIWVIFVFHCNTNTDKQSINESQKVNNSKMMKTVPSKIKPPRLHGPYLYIYCECRLLLLFFFYHHPISIVYIISNNFYILMRYLYARKYS